MKTKLITALRISANRLDNGEFDYDWRRCHSCNCGVVVCALLGKSKLQMESVLKPKLELCGNEHVTWKKMTGTLCPVTGMPDDELFAELQKAGLTQTELVELEYLTNPKVLKYLGQHRDPKIFPQIVKTKRSGFLGLGETVMSKTIPIDYQNPKHAAAYMRAWAAILEEETKSDTPEPAEARSEATTCPQQ